MYFTRSRRNSYGYVTKPAYPVYGMGRINPRYSAAANKIGKWYKQKSKHLRWRPSGDLGSRSIRRGFR